MFKNVIVTAVRVAFKQKLTTLLNILGIALGIAVSIVLIVHIRYETSYDTHIPGVDRICLPTSPTHRHLQTNSKLPCVSVCHYCHREIYALVLRDH